VAIAVEQGKRAPAVAVAHDEAEAKDSGRHPRIIDLEEPAIAARDQPELRWEAVGRADQSIKSWRTDDDGQEEPMRVSGALLFAVLASTVPALAAERLELPTREAGLWEISSETIGRPRRTFGLPNEERGSAGVIIIVAASIASESDD
jgi:hypothetical protein